MQTRATPRLSTGLGATRLRRPVRGFTLIELVVVIVILGILAATALPKFVNLQDDAHQATLDGIAGAISSASAINYSARKVSTGNTIPITNCSQVFNLLQNGATYTASGEYGFLSLVLATDSTPGCRLYWLKDPNSPQKSSVAYITGTN